MATITVTRDEVLAWMAADPTNRGPAAAAKHFGLKRNLVEQWLFRARRAAGVPVADRKGVRERAVRETVAHPALVVLPPPARREDQAKRELPADLYDIGLGVMRAVLDKMKTAATTAKPGELAQMLAAVGDRLPVLSEAKPKDAGATEVAPGSPEWEAAMLADLAALPPHLVQQAARRAGGAQ